MKPERFCVEDNEKYLKLTSNASSANVVTRAIVNGVKLLSQRPENMPLVQLRSVLDRPDPRGSGVETGHKNRYPEGILYPPVEKYLTSEPDLAKQKRLSSCLLERLRAGMSMPGRYVSTRIYPISTFGTFKFYVGQRTDKKFMGLWKHPITRWQTPMG